jgi:uncharacterized protein (TIGR00288 family)
MNAPYTRAPHRGGASSSGQDSPHAALLIDFDNFTMGMRSDLSKELKHLLDSDVIKGKVSVQRAYADWRRYPQYIVPLSEASVDLIFAPAYGSNKKNATDIRMAIDALELVFTRPEIGTFILLSGDSDFSSLVLKLKEYGKYVIGVGIQESSSDILVQNCDEYYSYTSLTGLTKTTELAARAQDPWVLVKDAVTKMVSRGDVLRSDRLKQVMQEIDPTFDERSIGFSKFSKFLGEASSRGLVELIKVGNGQYEVGTGKGRGGRGAEAEPRGRRDRGRGGRRERRESVPESAEQPTAAPSGEDPLQNAYNLLRMALQKLREAGREPARDSDVKRRILDVRPDFDENELGFPKFSKFLAQAEEHGVIRVTRGEAGLEVALVDGAAAPAAAPEAPSAPPEVAAATTSEGAGEDFAVNEGRTLEAPAAEAPSEPPTPRGPTVIDVLPSDAGDAGLRLGPRRGSTRRRGGDEPPPLFEGQGAASKVGELDGLGLPSDPAAIVRYLTHRYKGVGEKTAETLVEQFGSGLFLALRDDPEAVTRTIPAGRADQLIEAWKADYARRTGVKGGGGLPEGDGDGGPRRGRSKTRSRRRD